jgi:adenylate cyclase
MTYEGLTPDAVGGDEHQVFLMDKDGIIQLPTMQHETFYNLSVELALHYLGLTHANIRRLPDALEILDQPGKVLIHIPLTLGQLIEVNWFSKWDNPVLNPSVSAAELTHQMTHLLGDNSVQKAEAERFFKKFNDAIVLIGPTDPILQDIAPTPFDPNPVPKVGVYGNLLKMFFTGQYIRRLPSWTNVLWQFGLTALVAWLAMYHRHHAAWAKFGALLVVLLYIGGVFEAFARFNLVLPLITPVGSAFSTAFMGAIIRLIDEEKQKRRIKGLFSTYLAPEVVNDMVSSGQEPQLGGHNVVITCFFSDVQGFSGFSEVLPPNRLTDLMNEYLTAMTDILQHERGSLDKFIGDAIVAMYGAPVSLPDHALRACVAACRMQNRLGELRAKWIGEGDKWPDRVHKMRMRISLNTGETIVGNMGSASRFNYTMMGDPVNLAARCESGAKQFGVYTMCTEDTKNHAEKSGPLCVYRRLDRIIVKGRSTPVEVYEVVGLREEVSPEMLQCIEIFERGLALYFAQEWDGAKALFAEAEKLEALQPGRDPGVQHNPSELMQERCDEMKKDPPPADWNGVFEMTEK